MKDERPDDERFMGPRAQVGDLVWLVGWGAGPFIVTREDEDGRLLLVTRRGKDPTHDGYGFPGVGGMAWRFPPEALTTLSPPKPEPVPSLWTPTLLVRLVGGLAAIACALAALAVAT